MQLEHVWLGGSSASVTAISSVAIKTQNHELQKIEIRKLSFCLRGKIFKAIAEKTPYKTFAERTTERN
jgi:hypothetical protein